tara:strand:- start:47552 stop:48136 length:585 start_codon:yes stop_codon:yes gene_type:complete
MFNLKEISEEVKGGVNETYIYPGIRNNVILKKWTSGTNDKGTPFLSVHFVTEEGKAANVDPKEFKFYMTEKAVPTSLVKVKHIVGRITTYEKFESVDPANLEELADHLNDISQGGRLRMKFNGREYLNASMEIKESAEIGLPDFAEAIEDGAQYPAVAVEDTLLVFDKENKNDFEKVPVQVVTSQSKSPVESPW